MTLTVADFPEGAFPMEQDTQTSVGVKDGYQRLFGMCDCRIGESVPMFAVASVNILDGEELATLGMEAAASDFGRDFLSARFDKGADVRQRPPSSAPFPGDHRG
jgi:hypothetical protein